MTYIVQEAKVGPLTVKVIFDDILSEDDNPLTFEETFKISYRSSSRYILGNDPQDDPTGFLDDHDPSELFFIPVYTYIHSGVAMRTTPFSCPWDSGLSGFVYAQKAAILKECGEEEWTDQVAQYAIKRAGCLVESYGQYLNGEVYAYIVEDDEGNVIASCHGFLGDPDYALEEGQAEAEYSLPDYVN